MAEDKFSSFPSTPALPATAVEAIEPNDETDLRRVTIALNVSTPGTVRVTGKDGTTADVFLEAGTAFPLRVRRVWATGTTATGIRGLY